MLVMNLINTPILPEIVLAGGEKTTVQLMPRARANIQAGAVVSQAWLTSNPGVVKIVTDEELQVEKDKQTLMLNTPPEE